MHVDSALQTFKSGLQRGLRQMGWAAVEAFLLGWQGEDGQVSVHLGHAALATCAHVTGLSRRNGGATIFGMVMV
eukprot:1150379-Pelagomonas_calceolata.AAC.7